MIYCPPSELAFSQVREDPTIELKIIEQLACQQGHGLRVLLVASGGCTALSLLANPHVAKVEAVDINPAQLHLIELRRQALLHLPLEKQLQLIGADLTTSESARLKLYQELSPALPESTRNYWDERQEQIAFGVNRVGRFEQLFRELSVGFIDAGLDPIKNPEKAIQNPQWRSIFEQIFERDKLAATFGEAAVNYSMDRSFGEHFADVFARALQRFVPAKNYFITQVWHDRYTEDEDGVPIYLQSSAQTAIRSLGMERLELHQGAFAEKMPELANAEKFDLIQFSNISDWMPLPELHKMLANAVSCLKPGGALVGRRLNGDHHLASIMAEHLPIDEQLSTQLQIHDRSFFYREVMVGFCRL